MYARLASGTGWTWEYIGQCMTLPRLYAMMDYWRRYPPVNEIAAAWAGYKAPSDEKPAPVPTAAQADFVRNIRSMQR